MLVLTGSTHHNSYDEISQQGKVKKKMVPGI
jgi:hypothetical protein